MKPSFLIPLGTLVLGAAIGYIGGNSGGGESASASAPASESSGSRGDVRSMNSKPSSKNQQSLEKILKGSGQTARLESLMKYYGELDPALFGEEASKLENLPWSERLIASYLLFSRWGEVAPLEAIDHANKMGFAGMFVKPTVLQSWAGQDPENAAKYYTENSRDFAGGGRRRGGEDPSGGIAREWAKQDPQGALDWAKTLEGRSRSAAEANVFGEMASTDPAAAAKLLASSDLEDRDAAIEKIAAQWGETDWDSAQAWANGLPAEERDTALAQAITGLARTDTEAAATAALTLEDGRSKDNAMASVADQWGKEDPAGAMAWVSENGTDRAQERAARSVMMNWARQDDAGATTWLNEQESGDVRDRAVSSYVFANQSDDPKAVMEMAMSIENDRRQGRSVQYAARQWMATDKDSATEYIQSNESISERVRNNLLGND